VIIVNADSQHNIWPDAFPAPAVFLLHAVCCIGVALFLLLGGAGLSALLASRGFWVIAIGLLVISIGGYRYFRKTNSSSCTSSYFDEKKLINRNLF
tara:strand:- start:3178 stop:3465 length:288 start_codon:yes stop_codon:yes gene_type:complete